MALLRIRLFGAVRVSHGDRPPDVRLIHAVQGLLAWLVLNRRKVHSREAIAGVFWGEHSEDRARSCLSTALWRLKQALEPDGVSPGAYLISEAAAVGFNRESEHWLDVAAFEEGVSPLGARSGTASGLDWSRAEAALEHYGGDLLEGFYDDWAVRERERLRLLYLEGLAALLRHQSETGALDDALRCGQRILALDPLREDAHRELIRLHLRRGHRALALDQYERCRAVLDDELGVDPMEETRALCAELLPAATNVARAPAVRRTAPAAASAAPSRVAASLRNAAASLEQARTAILEALRLAESNPDRS
ncbi:MAG: BTAD domain-containing putative transcriptional regulator [Vicinamibacteria bacterium]